MRELWLKLKALILRRRLDRELREEMEFHLAMKQERTASTPREARRSFGNTTRIGEICRELWTFAAVERLARDLRYGLRVLMRTPAFTCVAILSLAVGIGGNTAMFTLAHSLLLKSLPVRDPQQLRLLTWRAGPNVPADSISGYGDFDRETQTQTSGSFSYPTYLAMRDRLADHAEFFAFRWMQVAATTGSQTDFARGQIVSGNYFQVLGVSPVLGRTIVAEDDRAEAAPAAVISYNFWERRYGGSATALGSLIALNGEPFTVVGILPKSVTGMIPGEIIDVYYPALLQPRVGRSYPILDNAYWWAQIMARLKPGVSDARFQSAAGVLFQQMALANVRPGQKFDVPALVVQPGEHGTRHIRRQISQRLTILLVVVALVLLIACANLASLMLARAAARRREIAVRLSIGAARADLIRQMLVESLILAIAGGLLGAVIASPLAGLTVRFGSGDQPMIVDTRLSLPVLAFTLGVSLFSALVFGLLPAFRSTCVDLSPALKQQGKAAGDSPKLRAGRALVAAQVALSVMLLVGAGLFLRTLVNLVNADVGFDARHLLLFRVDPARTGYKGAEVAAVYRRIRESLERTPGVLSVALSPDPLISGNINTTSINVPGFTPSAANPASTHIIPGSDGFVTAMGIPLLAGRDIQGRDTLGAPLVAVVNEAFVRRFMPGLDPVGRTFSTGKRPVEIVGLCKDAKYSAIRKPAPPTIYVNYAQRAEPPGSMTFAIRSSMPASALAVAARNIVAGIDRQMPLADIRTQEQQITLSIGPERFFAGFAGAFALMAALLAALGLYGVMAYNVARRTSEIGIRIALGARPLEVRRMIVSESIVVVLAGLAVGLPAAFGITRLLRGALFEVAPADPLSFVAGALAMIAVAGIASALPARRAARVDPLIALRYE